MKTIKVDEKLVRHVSDLARLELAQDEVAEYQKNFQEILDYVAVLDELNVEGVEPLYNPITEVVSQFEENLEQPFKLRSDQPRESLGAKEILKNAPRSKNNEFKIESVIEE